MAPAVAVWVWRPCAASVAHFSAVRPYLGSQELISLISVDGDTHALFMAPAPPRRNIKYTSCDAAINLTRVEHDGEAGAFDAKSVIFK